MAFCLCTLSWLFLFGYSESIADIPIQRETCNTETTTIETNEYSCLQLLRDIHKKIIETQIEEDKLIESISEYMSLDTQRLNDIALLFEQYATEYVNQQSEEYDASIIFGYIIAFAIGIVMGIGIGRQYGRNIDE